MNVQHLVKMANQIESFFRSEPDRDVAIAGIESHIRRFWAPRMRNAIIAHVAAGGEGLGELAGAAVRKCAAVHARDAGSGPAADAAAHPPR